MGDVLSLIEDIESKVDRAQAEKLASKLKKGTVSISPTSLSSCVR
jgi:signal recognition particle subunit SRP54